MAGDTLPDDSGEHRQSGPPAAARPSRWEGLLIVLTALAAIGLGLGGGFLYRGLNRGVRPQVVDASHPLPARIETAKPTPLADLPLPASSLPPTAMKPADLRRECQEVAAEISQRYPNTPYALAILAQSQAIQGKHVDAMKSWEKCLESDPGFVDGYQGMIELAARDGDFAKAVEIGRRALAVTRSMVVCNTLANSLLRLDKPQEAVQVLEESLKQNDPRAPPTLYLLAKANAQLHKWELAKKYYAAAIEANPDYFHAYYGISTACARLGEKEQSQRYLAQFKRLQKQAETDLVRVRHARAEIGELEPEREVRDEAVVITGLLSTLHASAGKAYYNLRDARKAEENWRRAADLHPADLESRRALLMLQRQEGRLNEAVATLKEIIEIEPKSAANYVTLGALYGAQRQFDHAEEMFQKVCQLRPREPLGYALLAKLYVDADRKTSEASSLARKAVELAPNVPNYALCVEACLKNKDTAGARAAAQEALRRDPQNPAYKKLYESIAEKK